MQNIHCGVGVLLRDRARRQSNHPREDSKCLHIAPYSAAMPCTSFAVAPFTFLRYSGYMVSAPPRVASKGTPWRSPNSLTNVLVPGRWLGITPLARSTSRTTSHG